MSGSLGSFGRCSAGPGREPMSARRALHGPAWPFGGPALVVDRRLRIFRRQQILQRLPLPAV